MRASLNEKVFDTCFEKKHAAIAVGIVGVIDIGVVVVDVEFTRRIIFFTTFWRPRGKQTVNQMWKFDGLETSLWRNSSLTFLLKNKQKLSKGCTVASALKKLL